MTGGPQGGPQGGYQGVVNQDAADDSDQKGPKGNNDPNLKSTILKSLETAATTLASIVVLGCVGSSPSIAL
jgi:hypothetical protein